MRVFVNEMPLVLKPENKGPAPDTAMTVSNPTPSQLATLYQMLREGKMAAGITCLFSDDVFEEARAKFKKNFVLVTAAGGIVRKKGLTLFIHRLGKWDFPKGKAEPGEKPDETALREVEEECNVKVSISKKVCKTWHTYELYGKPVLKCTHWYEMDCLNDTGLNPQLEEGIEKVVWADAALAENELLPQAYASIRQVYNRAKA